MQWFAPSLHSQLKWWQFSALYAVWLIIAALVWVGSAASYLPTPLGVLQALPKLWEEGLGVQILTSLLLNFEAVAIMFLVSFGIAIASIMPAFRPLAVLVSSGRFNGFVGMPLIFTAFLHDAHSVKIALLVYGVGAFMTLSLVRMVQDIPRSAFDHSRTLRMGEWRVIWEVVVLGRFAEVLDILAVNAAMVFMMLPMVEGRFRYEGGIGAMMENEAKHFNMEAVFCALVVVLLLGLLQDRAINYTRVTICPYSEIDAAGQKC